MSLFGSLTTAVSGLDAQQDALGNISNNIANSQTIGYKDVGTAFTELVTQSNQSYNAPGGVIATPVYMNSLAGSAVGTQTNTNLAISGSGFFVVKAPPAISPNGTTTFNGQNLYTQAGDFQLNKSNYLVNSGGYYLEGYPVNPTTGSVDTANLQPIQISQTVTQPQATSNAYLDANLPAGLTTKAGDPGYSSPAPVTQTVYDAQGNPYTMTTQFDFVASTNASGTPANTDTWQATVSISPSPAGSPAGSSTNPYVIDLNFSNSGTTAGTLNSITAPTTNFYANGSLTGGTIGTNGVAGVPGTAPAATAAFNFATTSGSNLPITLNLGTIGSASPTGNAETTAGITEFNGTDVDVASKNQDGVETGQFQSVSIDQNGIVSVNYTNGTTRPYFQIPLAQFNAPQDLGRMTGSVFEETAQSGTANVSQAGTNGNGTLTASEVEQSNVDIAGEFTKMIVAQQAYSANSKVITTANELMSSLMSIIQ